MGEGDRSSARFLSFWPPFWYGGQWLGIAFIGERADDDKEVSVGLFTQ
jgi:hypothetical protein